MTRSTVIDEGYGKFSAKQALLVIANYFVGYILIYQIVAEKLSKMFFGVSQGIHPVMNFLLHLFTIVTMLMIIWKPLLRSWREFTKDKKLGQNIIIVFKNMGLLYLTNIAINIFIDKVLGLSLSSENQVAVESALKSNIFVVGFMVVIFAPLVEEFVFRGVLYQYFRSKQSFIVPVLISVLLFGLIHVLPEVLNSGNYLEFIYLLQYCPMAYFMIRSLEMTDSIFGSIGVHFLNNLIGFLVITFIK